MFVVCSFQLTLLPKSWLRQRCCTEVCLFLLPLIFDPNHPHPNTAVMCTGQREIICKLGAWVCMMNHYHIHAITTYMPSPHAVHAITTCYTCHRRMPYMLSPHANLARDGARLYIFIRKDLGGRQTQNETGQWRNTQTHSVQSSERARPTISWLSQANHIFMPPSYQWRDVFIQLVDCYFTPGQRACKSGLTSLNIARGGKSHYILYCDVVVILLS